MNRFKLVGKIKPKCSLEIPNSPFSIGLEKLDRKVFDPNRTYDKLALFKFQTFSTHITHSKEKFGTCYLKHSSLCKGILHRH